MAKDPAFLFYPGDFLMGVADLTMDERGQYITLLCLQHQKGHLNEKTIRLTLGSVSNDVLSKFEKDTDGLFFNSRLDEEIGKRLSFVDSRKENGKKGGRPKKPSGKPYAKPNGKASDNLPEDRNENEIINKDDLKIYPSFEDFWRLYDKKIGKKDKIFSKWKQLPQAAKEAIMQYIPNYIKSQPDKQFRKNPETFLNNEGWNDEIIIKSTTTSNSNTAPVTKVGYAEQ